MVTTHILGYPRIGAQRELKFAQEAYWLKGKAGAADNHDVDALAMAGNNICVRNLTAQQQDLDFISVGDFTFYDHMLDTALMLGVQPARFDVVAASPSDRYFSFARGTARHPAMEMTKWFDTNYHYLVPELQADQTFTLDLTRLKTQIAAAMENGADASQIKPVLVGPLTFLWLSKFHDAGTAVASAEQRIKLMPALALAYRELLRQLAALGILWVQIDEPALTLDLQDDNRPWLDAFAVAYQNIGALADRPQILLATYFDSVAEVADLLTPLPIEGIHLDLIRAPHQLDTWLQRLPPHWVLSAGIIDGRNVWRANLDCALELLIPLHELIGERLWIAPSCSLLHVPVSLASEPMLDVEIRSWLAFAEEKLQELRILKRALNEGTAVVADDLLAARKAQTSRRNSSRVNNAIVQRRLRNTDSALTQRNAGYGARNQVQRAHLDLPLLPTTTIGSFPQTAAIRAARAAYKRREIGALDYLEKMRDEIRIAVAKQESIGLDVLVHGEAERNDMVEYFGEKLLGYAFTANGWVQSYGSRCVKPPLIYGDVHRPEAMTVETSRYAQSLTAKPLKGMLTGPVTLLQWSFVRDDQPRATTALQLAWCVRDEVDDLQKAGIKIIQIDEPAFREGLPLKRKDWQSYLDWAVGAFKLAACVANDATQIHTHMCYSEFNDILPAIAAMDADVITIETSRSKMKLLDGFASFAYPNEIGPGLYDIHSPREPRLDEMTHLLERACSVIPVERLWVNPDCGLKTRGWPETEAALTRMVETAKLMRARLAETERGAVDVNESVKADQPLSYSALP